MLMPSGSPSAGPDRVWSTVLSQLERAALPRQPVRPQPREGRYVVRLVQRDGHGPDVSAAGPGADVFDALSCMLVACSGVGRDVRTASVDDAWPLVSFVTRLHAARVMARLGPVLASCNERLQDGPWEFVATRMDAH